MAIQSLFCLLALASFVPSTLSAPILGREECVCQPMDFTGSDNSSMAACEAIARDVQQWRALAFHSPYLADIFVDAEERLRVTSNGHVEKHRFAHEIRTITHHGEALRTTFGECFLLLYTPSSTNAGEDHAVRDIFRRLRKPSKHRGLARKGKTGLQPPPLSRLHGGPARPVWPWEAKKSGATKIEDKSPGRAVEEATKAGFLQPAHRYRILCRAKDTPRTMYFAIRPDLMLVASIIIVAVWLFVCDMMLAICRK
jgi:hypothetical protein